MKKIGIIGAMELEVEALKAQLTDPVITTRAGMRFYEGTLNGAAVVVVQSGIGKVNAALCVQVLADLFSHCLYFRLLWTRPDVVLCGTEAQGRTSSR